MSNAVATLDAPKRSLLADMAGRYGMEPKAFADTLRATVVPPKATNEEFAAFLLVAKEYDLNPITKEIYAFPKQGGGIQPIVSVDGWANLINSHPQCDGIEFEDSLTGDGKLVSITCRIYRKDRSRPTCATEYMEECRRDTSTWKQWPRRMLRHKALIQAARYAFGFAGIIDPDEAERGGTEVAPRLAPPPAPKPPKAPALTHTKPSESTPQPEIATLPPDWVDYLDRQFDEYISAQDAGSKQGVNEAVSDAITAAQERGELSGELAELVAEDWNARCSEADA